MHLLRGEVGQSAQGTPPGLRRFPKQRQVRKLQLMLTTNLRYHRLKVHRERYMRGSAKNQKPPPSPLPQIFAHGVLPLDSAVIDP